MDGYPATPETEWRGRESNYGVRGHQITMYGKTVPPNPDLPSAMSFNTQKDGNLANDLLLQRVYSYCSSKSALT